MDAKHVVLWQPSRAVLKVTAARGAALVEMSHSDLHVTHGGNTTNCI